MTEKRLALVVAMLVIAAVIVPFTLLSGVRALAGAFLFWVVFALVVMGLIVVATRRWREP
ncbi:MAG TPA: hypothetical protein VK966_04515 [Longimicrobiales bacterium]|nr:hypothetical protein [Longimicrobiales bacterium]